MGVYDHPIPIGPRNWKANALVCAHRDKNCLETFSKNVIQVLDLMVQTQIDSQIHDILDFPFDDLRGQAVFRHTQPKHAPCDRHGLKNRHPITGV